MTGSARSRAAPRSHAAGAAVPCGFFWILYDGSLPSAGELEAGLADNWPGPGLVGINAAAAGTVNEGWRYAKAWGCRGRMTRWAALLDAGLEEQAQARGLPDCVAEIHDRARQRTDGLALVKSEAWTGPQED